MDENVRRQILEIRDSGLTNMFDTSMVQALADKMGFYELVAYIEEHRREYIRFILTGKI